METPAIKENQLLLDALQTPLGWAGFALTQKGLLTSTFMYASETEALSVLRTRKLNKIISDFVEIKDKEKFQTLLQQWRSLFSTLLAGNNPAKNEEIPIDEKGWTEFAKKVYDYLRTVPAGETVTYGEIAHAVGSPGASRAVGMLMKKNPIPPVVPCHRVLSSDGKLGGFSAAGGPALKRKMLENETDPKGLLFPL